MIYSLPVIFLSATIFLYNCNCQIIDVPSDSFKLQGQAPYKPKAPVAPDCSGFPGSSQWNKCWAKFHDDMANFQQGLEEYMEKVKKQSNKPNTSAPNSNYYSNSYSSYFQSSNGANSQQYSNTVSVNGYYIRTNGLPVSTQTNNGVMKITLGLNGPVDSFDHQVNGQELDLKMTIGGQKKFANIKIPPKVKMDQLKIERTSDVIQISGPSGSDGSYSVNSFSSSGGAVPPFSPPKFQMPPMPSFPTFPMNFPFRSDMWFF